MASRQFQLAAALIMGAAGIASIGLAFFLSSTQASKQQRRKKEICGVGKRGPDPSPAAYANAPAKDLPPDAPPPPPVTNEMLAKRLVHNPDFRFKLPVKTKLQLHVESIATQAMWDSVKSNFEAGSPDGLLKLLSELKGRLAALTPKRADLIAQLDAVMDEDLLKQQLSAGALDVESLTSLVRFIVGRIRDLESPARNALTDEFLKDSSTVLSTLSSSSDSGPTFLFLRSFFDFCHGKIDHITLDLLNFRLDMLRPTLAERGVEYVRANFELRVAKGEVGVEQTKKWLGRAVSDADPAIQAAMCNGDARAFVRTHAVAVLDQVWRPRRQEKASATAAAFPETLDADSTVELRRRVRSLCRSGFVLLRIKQFGSLTDDAVSAVQALLSTPSEALEISGGSDERFTAVRKVAEDDGSLLGPVAAQRVVAIVLKDLTGQGCSLTEPQTTALKQLVSESMEPPPNDAVFALVEKRLRAAVEAAVLRSGDTSSPAEEKEKAGVLALLGLGALNDATMDLCADLRTFAKRDYQIHCSRYNSLIASAARGIAAKAESCD